MTGRENPDGDAAAVVRAPVPDRAAGPLAAGRRRAAPRDAGPAGRPAGRRAARGAGPPGRGGVVDPGARRPPARPGAALAAAGGRPGGAAGRAGRGRPDQPPHPRGEPQRGATGRAAGRVPRGPGRAGPPAGGVSGGRAGGRGVAPAAEGADERGRSGELRGRARRLPPGPDQRAAPRSLSGRRGPHSKGPRRMRSPTRTGVGLAALVASAAGAGFARADGPAKPAATPQQARAAVGRGLDFLLKDAAKWRKEHECSTCHHGTMTVWALSEAKARGYEVAAGELAELARWTKDRLLA